MRKYRNGNYRKIYNLGFAIGTYNSKYNVNSDFCDYTAEELDAFLKGFLDAKKLKRA